MAVAYAQPIPVPRRPTLRLAPPRRRAHRRPAAAALIIAALIGLGAGRLTAGGGPAEPRPAVRVEVAPGDTLWALAVRHAPPGRDPRAAVDAIVAHNHLSSPVIHPGDVLEIP